jgi:hypothetical protein
LLFNLVLWKLNFFVLSGELYLTLPWLFLWGVLMHRGYSNYWLLVPIMLVVLWSHPLCVVVFVLLNFLFGYEKRLAKWFWVSVGGILLLRVILVSDYDVEKVSQAFRAAGTLWQTSGWQYVASYIQEYLLFFPLAALWLYNGQLPIWRRLAVLFIWLALLFLCYQNQYGMLDWDFTKWLLPVHFIGVFSLYLSVAERDWNRYGMLVLSSIMVFTFIGDAKEVYHQFGYLQQRVSNFHCLISVAQQKGYHKSYLVTDEFKGDFGYNSFQQESIVLSQFPRQSMPVQVAIIDKSMETKLVKLDPNMLYIGPDYEMQVSWLKTPFNVLPDEYHKLHPEDCECLQFGEQ